MPQTPDQAHAKLNAADLTPEEMRVALVYLCGYSPDGTAAAVAMTLRQRRARDITQPCPPRAGDLPFPPAGLIPAR